MRSVLGLGDSGYDNRAMAAQVFNQEGQDADHLGAGDSVVAFYEIIPVGVGRARPESIPTSTSALPTPRLCLLPTATRPLRRC